MPGGWSDDDDDRPDPKLVAYNARQQARLTLRLVRQGVTGGRVDAVVTPEVVRGLQRIAMEGILSTDRCGRYRGPGVFAPLGGRYIPPPFELVPSLVEDMCTEVARRTDDPFHAAAYAMWRTCWIHPFVDGNGRVARALSYLVLSVCFGFVIPGRRTIPERIETSRDNRREYYDGLTAADLAVEQSGAVNVDVLERLLRRLFTEQVTEDP
jgi:Fic family protein